MSIKAMTWAFEQPLGGNAKVVLLALADFADDDGQCWPSIRRIAEKSHLSERSVQRILLELADQEYLSSGPRQAASGASASNMYQLHMAHGGRVTDCHPEGDTVVTGEGDTVVTPYEPSIRTVSLNTKRGARVGDDFTPDAKAHQLSRELGVPITQDLIDDFIDYWRAVPGAKGLKLDWQATFRNRLRYQQKFKRNASANQKPGSITHGIGFVDSVFDAEERRIRAEIERLERGAVSA